jgi:alkanesulfonate monooxygenase SsuD/methylene tetrahydromethanopterin reductase-like flavin-dependent oxidoreductase (luciferase family)
VVVDVQLSAASVDWPRLRDAALTAEAAGFGALWVFDHLAGGSLSGDRMLECTTLLGALAVTTTRIPLGTLVANVWNREPGVLGIAAASVVEVSGGRPLYLGLGAGSSPTSRFAAEHRAVGATIAATLAERHARVERTLTVLDEMWRDDRPDHMATFPLPRPRPVVLVGVNSRALAEVAGRRADGINVRWFDDRRDDLLAVAVAARDPARPFLTTAYARWDEALLDGDHRERRAMEAAGVDRLVLAVIDATEMDQLAKAVP